MSELGSKKYEMTEETKVINGHTVHRIRALRDMRSWYVWKGNLGGWIEDYDSLAQDGECWVGDEAVVYDGAYVTNDALVGGKAIVQDSCVSDTAIVVGNAIVQGTMLSGYCSIGENAEILADSVSLGYNCQISGCCTVNSNARIYQGKFFNGVIDQDASIKDNADYLFLETAYGEFTYYRDKSNKIRYNFQNSYVFIEGTIDEFDQLFDDNIINSLFEEDDANSITSYKLFCQQLKPVVKQYFNIS